MIWLLLTACTPETGAFSALTYNVQGLPDGLAESPRPTADRMADIAPMLVDYDLVGVQESFDADWHAILVGEADHPVSRWFGAPLDGRVYGSGLGLLARVGEPGAYEEHYYAACNGTLDGGSDCLASKGFQVQVLELGRGTVAVVNTHHEAGGGEDDNAVRLAQVGEVLAWADAHPEHAILFLGDTNLRPSDPDDAEPLATYAAAGFRDACTEIGCDEADHIDRFYLRDSQDLALMVDAWSRETRFVDAEGADLSDHPAISVELSWTELR